MGVVPQTINGKIQFFETHLPVWAKDPAAIGLTPAQILTMTNDVAQARADYDAAQAGRSTAKALTQAQNDSVSVMADFGGDLIKTIRAFAETTNDTGVYVLAEIPAPAPPTPLGPPATPTDLAANLNTAGEITLKWAGTRAGGTSFAIERSTTGNTGPWTLIGTSEERSFTDTVVPRGVDAVTYRVIASRAGGSSAPSASVAVLFGNSNTAGESSSGEGLTLAA